MNPPSLFYQQALRRARIPNANPFPTVRENIMARYKAKTTTLPNNPNVVVFEPSSSAPLQNFPEKDTAAEYKQVQPTTNLTPPTLEPTTST